MNLIFTELGYFGPHILATIISCSLYQSQTRNSIPRAKYKIINFLLATAIISEMLNRTLKQIIKQPRPDGIDYYNSWDSFKDNKYFDSYGMPSGHAQNVATAATFLILYKKNLYITIYSILQSFLTMYQRYAYKKHTPSQLGGGAYVGTLMGIISYNSYILYMK